MSRMSSVLPGAPRRIVAALALVTGAIPLLVAYGLQLDEASRYEWMKEGGPVEIGAALAFFLDFVLIVISGHLSSLRRFALLFVMFALRELDFDKRFTTVGILKSKFFFSPEVSPLQKLAGAVVLLALAWAVIGILRRYSDAFIDGLRQRTPVAVASLLAMACLVVSKAVDGLGRKLQPLGVELSTEDTTLAEVVEETLELGAAAYIMVALWAWFARDSSRQRVSV